MPCCRADWYGGWCIDKNTFMYKGEEYCYFHLPADAPEKQDVKSFNKAVINVVDDCKQHRKTCELIGVIFPGAISFDQCTNKDHLPDISFLDAEFYGYVRFDELKFGGYAHFEGAEFNGDAGFYNAEFNGEANFDESKLNNRFDFRYARFNQKASFEKAEFSCGSFSDAHFSGTSKFLKSIFIDCDFDGCTTDGIIEFDQADLSGLSLLNAPLEKMRFIDCKWPKHKGRSIIYDARQVDGIGYFQLDDGTDQKLFQADENPPTPAVLPMSSVA